MRRLLKTQDGMARHPGGQYPMTDNSERTYIGRVISARFIANGWTEYEIDIDGDPDEGLHFSDEAR
jgi:hypothetical protein